MRYANIKKASQGKQQNQTTRTNLINIKKIMSVLKKINNKVKRASDKTETKNVTFNSPEEI